MMVVMVVLVVLVVLWAAVLVPHFVMRGRHEMRDDCARQERKLRALGRAVERER